MPGLSHWQSPNFMAFFPCPSSYPSILGELYSAAFTGACFNWICSPAATELETIVLDWLAQLLGLPATYLSSGPTRGGGVIHGSASESVMTMMVAARDKYLRETLPAVGGGEGDAPDEEALEDLTMRKRARMVALGSAACHSSTKKAANILGVRYAAVPVSSATGYAMTGPALAETLAMCRARGWEPFFLTATLGTTDTCAVDDFEGIADALDEHARGFAAADDDNSNDEVPARKKGEVWVHVDAAYAGAALVTPEAQRAAGGGVRHLRRFHSLNTNMHKWLLTNFDASCSFVASRGWLEASALGGAELPVYRNAYSDGGLVTDYRNWQVPLGRRFRSLKVWFVLRSYGGRGLREYIRRGVRQGELFAGLVAARPDLFEVLAGPAFALTVFRMAAPTRGGAQAEEEGGEEEQRNALTRRLYDEVNRTGKIWVTGTVLEGSFAIRVMTGNRLTEEEHVRAAFGLFQATAERIVSER